MEGAEENRKRLQRDLDTVKLQLEEKEAAYEKLDRTKTRIQQELDDLLVNQDSLRQLVNNMERKQRKFDQVSWIFPRFDPIFNHLLMAFCPPFPFSDAG